MIKVKTASQALQESSQGVIMAIYAEPGGGKTFFSITATENKKVLYIDTEKRLGKGWAGVPTKLRKQENLFAVDVSDIQGLLALVQDPDIHQYDVLVIDSLTHLVAEHVDDTKEKKGKSLSFAEWGELGFLFRRAIVRLQKLGISVLFTVHAKESTDQNKKLIRPNTDGNSVVQVLIERCDLIGFLPKPSGEEMVHKLFFESSSSDYFVCKKGIATIPNVFIGEDISFENVAAYFPKFERIMASKKDVKMIEDMMKEADISTDKQKTSMFGFVGLSSISDMQEHHVPQVKKLIQMKLDKMKQQTQA